MGAARTAAVAPPEQSNRFVTLIEVARVEVGVETVNLLDPSIAVEMKVPPGLSTVDTIQVGMVVPPAASAGVATEIQGTFVGRILVAALLPQTVHRY